VGSEIVSWYGQEFSLLIIVQTGSGAHPRTYPMPYPEVKLLGHEADQSSPSSAEVKKTWIYNTTSSYAFMV
jgi:hypothetical protein